MAGGKALSADQNERLRVIVRRLIDRYGGQVALEEKLGGVMKQSTISGFLAGRQGTSIHVAQKVCELDGSDIGEVLGFGGKSGAREIVYDYSNDSPEFAAVVRRGSYREDTIAQARLRRHANGAPLSEEAWKAYLDDLERVNRASVERAELEEFRRAQEALRRPMPTPDEEDAEDEARRQEAIAHAKTKRKASS